MYADGGMKDLFGVHLLERIVGFLAKVPKDGLLPGASPTDSVETLRMALRVLWHCGNDPRGRRETLQADGVRVISAYLDAGDAKVREAAVCALNVVSLETKGKQDILEHSPEGLARLLLNDVETPYLHETCVQLVRCASELPAFRFAFARRIVTSTALLEKIYGTPSMAAVSPLLAPEEPVDTRVAALQVILHFLSHPSPGDTIRVPPVCPLENVKDPRAFALEECVDILHNLVSLLDVARQPAAQCLQVLCELPRNKEELLNIVKNGRVRTSPVAEEELAKILGDA